MSPKTHERGGTKKTRQTATKPQDELETTPLLGNPIDENPLS